MRPTLRTTLLLAAGVPVSLIAVLISGRLWTVWLAYVALAMLLVGVDAVLGLRRARLRLDVRVPEILYIGDTGELVVGVSAPGWQRPLAVELLCELDHELAPVDRQRVVLAPGQASELTVPLWPRRRGTLDIVAVWARWSGPLGLTRRQVRRRIDERVRVLPNVRAVQQAALAVHSRDALFGAKLESFLGDGSAFESLRDYMPGMDRRSIDWKHSARHRRLVSKEFRAERNHQIILAMDSGHLMSEPLAGIPRLDHALTAGLLLGYMSLRAGDRVGFFGFDARVRAYAEPVGGVHSFARLQAVSSGLDYHHEETNFTLGLAELAARLGRRSLIAIMTDFVDTITAELMIENIARLARRHLVVLVALRDPELVHVAQAQPRKLTDVYRSVVAADFVREREVVLERLRRLGAHVVDAEPARVPAALLGRYFDIKRRELI